MSAGPLFAIDCKGCGRTGTTPRLTDIWTVEYCPDCRALNEKPSSADLVQANADSLESSEIESSSVDHTDRSTT